MSRRSSVRRNRVDERCALAIAGIGALLALLARASPTGSTVVDAVLTFAVSAAVIWASASAPWWAVAASCGLAAAIAIDPVVALVGLAGFVLGLAVGIRQRDNAELRALTGAVAVNTFIRSELDGFHGLSALIGITACAALFVVGLSRRKSAIRRPGWVALGVTGGAAVLAVLGLAVTGAAARPDVSEGAEAARRALDALDAGDYDRAAQLFDAAAANFDAAAGSLQGGLALPARLVPAVSQNVRAGGELAEVAASSLGTAAEALREIDPSELAVRGGSIDVAAVRAVEAPLVQVQAALDDLQDVTSAVRSPWLVGPLQRELDELEADLARQEPRLANAIDAVRVAPALLGDGEPRRYLVLFTSPAEARGLGGFVGNYAEVEIDDGRISVGEFDRRSDLEAVISEAGDVRCDGCPEELINAYAPYGFASESDGSVGPRVWSNITMPVYFPYVAESAQVLYPQSGGVSIDGVIVMDPYVVQALMAYTGPIEVPELGVTVRPENAADFILREQYLLAGDDANADRIDALETLGSEVIVRLLSSDLPEPVDLADVFAPLVEQRRLMIWTDRPDEQDLLDRIGLLGSVPALDEQGGFSVAVTNAGASKIDVFLERDVDVEVMQAEDGSSELRATITLTNTAPAEGLPAYVIGNSVGLPSGSSRLLVAFYGPPGLVSATEDGEPIATSVHPEAGWVRYGTVVTLGPGESVAYELVFDLGELPLSDVEPTLFEQPLLVSG